MDYHEKSTPEELKEQFNRDVENYVNLETGQTTTMDSQLVIDLIERSITATTPQAQSMCDIGCGGGNFALRVLKKFPNIEISLLDISPNMLHRAEERITKMGGRVVQKTEGDIRDVVLPQEAFDIITAAAVLHHLRTQSEWHLVMEKIYRALKPGGTFWIWDLVKYENPQLQQIQEKRYEEYLIQQDGETFQKHIFARIAKADTPESSSFIFQAMLRAGFLQVDIIHKNALFCAIYGKK